ncbi:hypothetical protein [Roseibium sediminis]|uniref:hypothetical protein n=1 Tax=Roseibium sediminis TaxID=1775174 RepID=UPI00123CE285|nr:hypothetical protein [Roseibium sediminis]
MIEVTEDDWREYPVTRISFPILEAVLDGQSPNLHFGFIAELYRKYRLGDWEGRLPAPIALADKTYLMWKDEAYCLFHSRHEKFGEHIIECAHPYSKNAFVFFDYSILGTSFAALNKGGGEQLPYIPTYYAHPHDRYDYKTGAHMW